MLLCHCFVEKRSAADERSEAISARAFTIVDELDVIETKETIKDMKINPVKVLLQSLSIVTTVTVAVYSFPASSQAATPISNQYGVAGSEPHINAWKERIKQEYQICLFECTMPQPLSQGLPTPITDQYGAIGTEPNISLWATEIRSAKTVSVDYCSLNKILLSDFDPIFFDR